MMDVEQRRAGKKIKNRTDRFRLAGVIYVNSLGSKILYHGEKHSFEFLILITEQ